MGLLPLRRATKHLLTVAPSGELITIQLSQVGEISSRKSIAHRIYNMKKTIQL